MQENVKMNDVVQLIKNMQKDIKSLQTRETGVVYVEDQIITVDPISGVKTVIGDLSSEGESRYGIKEWVGDTEPPPIPTAPIVVAHPGYFAITWDGGTYLNIPQAADFDRMKIYGNNGTSTVMVGSVSYPDEIAVYSDAVFGEVWRFWMCSVDKNNNESMPSANTPNKSILSPEINPDIEAALVLVNDKAEEAKANSISAQSTAANASNVANSANDKALEAAGIASDKGKVLTQNSAPDAGDRNVNTLWIDTTNGANTPKRWTTGTTWVAVTDKTAVDAASVAGQAKTAADLAYSQSVTAAQVAGDAQIAANGKNRVWTQNTAPAGTAHRQGDLWFNTTAGKGNQMATWNATTDAWDIVAIGSAALATEVNALITGADEKATQALSSANGKNRIIDSINDKPAAITGYIAGDIWRKWDNMGTSGKLLKSWTVKGAVWVEDTMATSYLPLIDIGQGTFGSLNGDRLIVNTVLADKVAIGSTENLVPDDSLETPLGGVIWQGSDPSNATVATDITYGNAGKSIKLPLKTGAPTSSSLYVNHLRSPYYIPVVPGESYRITTWLYLDAATVGNITSVQQRVYLYPSRTGSLSNQMAGTSIAPANIPVRTWFEVGGNYTIPAGMYFLNPRATMYYPTNTANLPAGGAWYASTPKIVRAADGLLIVDGAIKAGSAIIDNAAIDYAKIASIDLNVATVNSLNGQKITAKTLSVDKLLVGSLDNIIPDPYFFNNALDWGAPSANYVFSTTGGRDGGTSLNLVSTAGGQLGRYSRRIQVTEGATYRVSAWARANVAVPRGALNIYVNRTVNGSTTVLTGTTIATHVDVNGATQAGNPAVAANVWVKLEGIYTVPAGTATIAFGVYKQTGLAGANIVNYDEFTAVRMGDGNLIVDGAINGKTITGALIQTLAANNRGITLDGITNKLTAWNASGVKTFELDGATGNLLAIGEYYSDVAGKPRVRISDSLYGANYAGMTFEVNGTSTGLVAGIKTSLTNDYWKGALFLTSATNPNNGYDTNMSELRLASDRINYFVKGPDTVERAVFEMEVSGYVATTVLTNTGSINQEVRNSAGTLLSWTSQSANLYQNRIFGAGGLYKSTLQLQPDDIMLSWAGTSSVDTYNKNAYFWMNNTGGVPKAEFTLTNGWVEAPRLRLTATNDASETSTLHAFQIGADSAQSIKMDDNEIVSTNAAGALQKIYVPGGMNFDTSYTMTGDTHVMTLGTYKKWIDPTILGTQSLDTMTATGDYAQDKNADATIARKYPAAFAGLLEVRNPLGAVMIYQRYTTYDSTQKMYTRTKYNTAWTAWVQH